MSGRLTFKGGIHPLAKIHHGKPLTETHEIVEMPAPKVVKIPLSQHIGAPSTAIVSPGDHVKMGTKIGEASGFVSVPCYSSVSGTVLGIEKIPTVMGKSVDAVVIENDFLDEKEEVAIPNFEDMQPQELIDLVKETGLVGMGGATFPTHVKLSPPPGKKINLLIINGAECEPFLTADHRLMLEQPDRIVYGVKALMHALGISKAFIGIEDNKMNAVESLTKAVDTHNIKVVALQTKYPHGGEKQLINAITGRVVPSGALPAEVGCAVVNIATAKAFADRLLDGEPLIRRVVTVTGSVKNPSNLLVRIGTSFKEVFDYVGGFNGEPMKLICGGPMMGMSIPSLDCAVSKGTSGLLVLGKEYMPKKQVETDCIRCGKCASVCPIHLMPMNISLYAEINDFEQAERLHAMDCISCGCCTYVCPAKRSVAQLIKLSKDQIGLKRAKERAKKQAQEKKENK